MSARREFVEAALEDHDPSMGRFEMDDADWEELGLDPRRWYELYRNARGEQFQLYRR